MRATRLQNLFAVSTQPTYTPDTFSSYNPIIIFNGVGALVDLKVTAAQDGSFSLPLFATQTPLGVAVSYPTSTRVSKYARGHDLA